MKKDMCNGMARTTPRTRAEIKNSTASLLELAKRYNISVATARKWKQRDSQEDLSHRPHKLCTTLTPAQEAIVVALRILNILALTPFGYRLGIDPILRCQCVQARLTMLYRSTHCLCCAGASV